MPLNDAFVCESNFSLVSAVSGVYAGPYKARDEVTAVLVLLDDIVFVWNVTVSSCDYIEHEDVIVQGSLIPTVFLHSR